MAEFPYLPLWTDAYLGDTTHLTTIEHGAYLLLLMVAWRSKSHSLPDDDKTLAKYTRLKSNQWRRVRRSLEPFFRIEAGQWWNERLLDEVESVRRKHLQRVHAGKRSALKRLNRGSTVVQRNANGGATPTPTPTPTKKEEVSKTTAPQNGGADRGDRGKRIPFESGQHIPTDYHFTAHSLGASETQIDEWWAEFVDFWSSLPGQKARKLDWLKTWRNRVREQVSRSKRYGGNGYHRKPDLKERLSDALQHLGSGDFGEIVDFGLPQLKAK